MFYGVTAKIPLEFKFETVADTKDEAVQKFWDEINKMSGKELKHFLTHNLEFDRGDSIDSDDIDWDEAKVYVSFEQQWYFLSPKDGEPVYFETKEEAEKEADNYFMLHNDYPSIENCGCGWAEDGEYVDGWDTASEEDY